MSKTSAERGDAPRTSGAADQVAADLHDGIEHRDLTKTIDEIGNARNSMSPQEYNAFLTDVNKVVDDKKVLPRLAVDIVGVDESGKNLVLVDLAAGRGSIVDQHGKMIKTLSEKQMLEIMGSGKHLLDSKEAKPAGDQFSVFMPPGLDSSGKDRLKLDSQTKSVDTNNGTTTTNVEGFLKDNTWGLNFSGYESIGKTKYSGSLVTTPDGKLLESHTKYKEGKFKDVVLFGGYQSSFPNIERGANFDIKELGGEKANPDKIDVKYNALADAYYATIDSFYHEAIKIKDGKAESIKLGNGFDDWNDLQRMTGADVPRSDSMWDLQKDADGYIKSFRHGDTEVSIARDANHEITKLIDPNGGVYTRTGDKQWDYVKDGKTTVNHGDLFVDEDRNVVLQKDNGAEITSIWGTRYDVNNEGFVTQTESDRAKEEFIYDKNQKIIKSIKTEYKPPSQYDPDTSRTITEEQDYRNGIKPKTYSLRIL